MKTMKGQNNQNRPNDQRETISSKDMITKSAYLAYLESEEKYKQHAERKIKVTKEMKAGQRIHDIYERLPHYTTYGEDGELELKEDAIEENLRDDELIMGMVDTLLEFEKRRLDRIKRKGYDPEKFFEALTREERIESHNLGMYGVVDALFRNQEGISVVELKSSFYSDNHKKELAFYKALVEDQMNLDITEGVVLSLSDDLEKGKNPKVFSSEELEEVEVEKDVKRVINEIVENPKLPNPRMGV